MPHTRLFFHAIWATHRKKEEESQTHHEIIILLLFFSKTQQRLNSSWLTFFQTHCVAVLGKKKKKLFITTIIIVKQAQQQVVAVVVVLLPPPNRLLLLLFPLPWHYCVCLVLYNTTTYTPYYPPYNSRVVSHRPQTNWSTVERTFCAGQREGKGERNILSPLSHGGRRAFYLAYFQDC